MTTNPPIPSCLTHVLSARSLWQEQPYVIESGFQSRGFFLFVKSGIREKFACGIRDPGLWNPELHLKESGIQVLLTKSPKSSSWNPGSMARNPESKTVLNFLEQYERNGDKSR